MIAAYYAGELVWRERERKSHEIFGAAPVPDWVFVAPKILAIAFVLLVTALGRRRSPASACSVQGLHELRARQIPRSGTCCPTVIDFLQSRSSRCSCRRSRRTSLSAGADGALRRRARIALPNLGFDHNLYRYGSRRACRCPT